jgi:hypothetical protein
MGCPKSRIDHENFPPVFHRVAVFFLREGREGRKGASFAVKKTPQRGEKTSPCGEKLSELK